MIDFNYKTNQLVVLLTLAASAVGWLVTGAFLSGLSIGVGVFLTWALAREIDPKHDYSALLAAGFSLINLFYYESVQLLVLGWLLLVLRMVNSLCGKPVTVFDMFSVLGLAFRIGWMGVSVVMLLLIFLRATFNETATDLVVVLLAQSAAASFYQYFEMRDKKLYLISGIMASIGVILGFASLLSSYGVY